MKRQRTNLGPTAVAVILVVVLPMLYVLSAGPAAMLANKTKRGTDVWHTVYYPLRFVENVPGAKRILVRYLNCWVTHLPGFPD